MELGFGDLAAIAALVVAIGSAFFTWGILMQQVKQHEKDIGNLGAGLERAKEDLAEGRARFAVIDTKLDQIIDRLDETKKERTRS